MTTRPTEFITGIIGSVLLLLTTFGIDLTESQVKAVLGVVAWIPLIVTFIVAWQRGERLFPSTQEAPVVDGLDELTVRDLQKKLRKQDLPVSGNKSALIQRLRDVESQTG